MLKGFYVAAVPQEDGGGIPVDAVDLLDTCCFGVIKVTGLRRPEADVYMSDRGGVDASYISGMSVKSRTITLEIDAQNDAQRMRMYKLLPYQMPRRFYAVTDAGTYWIDGYAKAITGDEEGLPVSSLELPIVCPYPWWRSVELHRLVIAPGADNTLHLTQQGDVAAGVLLYAQNVSEDPLAYIYSFTLSDKVGRYFSYSNGGDSKKTRVIVHADGLGTLLVDTTPGAHRWAKVSQKHEDTLANIMPRLSVSAEWILVDPNTGSDVSFTANPVDTYPDDFVIRACWYDTFTAI